MTKRFSVNMLGNCVDLPLDFRGFASGFAIGPVVDLPLDLLRI